MPAGWPTPFPDSVADAQAAFSRELVATWDLWVSRRVTTYDVRRYDGIHISHSIDYRVPRGVPAFSKLRAVLDSSNVFSSTQVFVPVLLMPRYQDGLSFDVTDERGRHLPLLDARGNQSLAVRSLAQTLREAWSALDDDERARAAVLAGAVIERCLQLASVRGTPLDAPARWEALHELRLAMDRTIDRSKRIGHLSQAILVRELTADESRLLGVLVDDERAVKALMTHAVGVPVHVAVELVPGQRGIINVRWLSRRGFNRSDHDPRPFRSAELPIAHVGGCETQHLQVLVEQDILVLNADVWTVLGRTAPRPQEAPESQLPVLKADLDVADHTIHANLRAAGDLGFGPGSGWLIYSYTTARTAIGRSLGAIAAACALLTIAAFALALSIELDDPTALLRPIPWPDTPTITPLVEPLGQPPTRPTQSLVGVMIFVGGLLGGVAPQLSLGPYSRIILRVAVGFLAVAAASTVVSAFLLALLDGAQSVAPAWLRWALIAGLGISSLVTTLAAVNPVKASLWIAMGRPGDAGSDGPE